MHFKRHAGDSFGLDYVAELSTERVLTGSKVVASVARRRGETPVLVKRSAAAGGSDDQVTALIAGSVLTGTVSFMPGDSRDWLGEYVWDIVLQTADGYELTLADGTLSFEPRVTRAFA